MANQRVYPKDGMCNAFEPRMETSAIVSRLCECMESGKFVTAEKLAQRLEERAPKKTEKWARLRADLSMFAFRPHGKEYIEN